MLPHWNVPFPQEANHEEIQQAGSARVEGRQWMGGKRVRGGLDPTAMGSRGI